MSVKFNINIVNQSGDKTRIPVVIHDEHAFDIAALDGRKDFVRAIINKPELDRSQASADYLLQLVENARSGNEKDADIAFVVQDVQLIGRFKGFTEAAGILEDTTPEPPKKRGFFDLFR